MTPRQTFAFFCTAAMWGGAFLYVRVLVDAGVEPLGVAASRAVLGFAAVFPIMLATRQRFLGGRRTLLWLMVLAVVNVCLPWTLIAVAGQRIPSGVSSIVNASLPLWVALLALALLPAASLTRGQAAGLVAGFGGVVALIGVDGFRDLQSDSTVGVALMLVVALSYGFAAVAIRRWTPSVPAVALSVTQLGLGSTLLVPVAFATGAYQDADLGWAEWSSMVAGGVGASGLGSFFYIWLLGEIGAVKASAITYLVPPIGVVLGWLVLDEPLGWNLLFGLVLIVTGLALVQRAPVGRYMRRLRRPPQRRPAPAAPDS